MPGLTSTQQAELTTALSLASSTAVERAFSRLSPHLSRGEWLDSTNQYVVNDIISELADQVRTGTPVGHLELGEYIAASIPLHCMDGWSFLGRAIEGYLRGDCEVAIHLAYYAELRAAMTILASQGIGIFNSHHFYLDNNNDCNRVFSSHLPTHKAAWLILENWAISSGNKITNLISVNGISLNDWINAYGVVSSSGSTLSSVIGADWLKTWGMDLSLLSSDHNARNRASYRPSRIVSTTSLSVLESSSFSRALWSLYEPSGPSVFQNLDNHLLRLSLQSAYQIATRAPSQNPVTFKKHISNTLARVGVSGFAAQQLEPFLTDASYQEPKVISEARMQENAPGNSPSRYHLQVISRAALLLRIATSTCFKTFKNTGTSTHNIEFWWSSLGETRGLWESTDKPNDMEEIQDLWDGINSTLVQMKNWEAAGSSVPKSYAHLKTKHASELCTLGCCELIALWGLCS